jgi:isoleucyl-tRNA synthetase
MSNTDNFYKKLDSYDITDKEDKVTKFWKENNIFEKSVEQRPEDNYYSFADGPPFVTGIPHWGHLAGRLCKDVIPRYKTMKGYRVRRVWGWDTHGVPIEEKTEKKLGLKDKEEVKKFGKNKFMKECRNYVEETTNKWQWYVDKIGEWIDMDNAYQTMDESYMESVIWGFKKLYDKGLVYKGAKTLLYCPRCGTPLSRFEIAMDDSYDMATDDAVTVKFDLHYHKSGRGVGIVIENEKGEILMGLRDENNREKSYGIIGGKLDGDESIKETIKRECTEEIGVIPNSIEIVGSSVDIFEGRIFHTTHVKARLDSSTDLEICEDFSSVEWVKKDKIPWDQLHIPTKNTILDVLGKKDFPKMKTEKPKIFALAWTTTPWTLPSNRALVVDKDTKYVTILKDSELLVIASERLEDLMGDDNYTVIDEYKGKELLGISYTPPFTFVEPNENDWKVYSYQDMVNMEEGTGIVHSAPGFGEIDTEMGEHYGLTIMFTVDGSGKFKDSITDYAGVYIRKADDMIIKDLEEMDNLFEVKDFEHRYPFCYRCETPLFHRSVHSWFINVQDIKDRLLEQSKKLNWVPDKFRSRFENNIKDAPDWSISRTRYWATAIPIWECDNCDSREVFGSVEEIEERSGQEVTTLHRNGVDHIEFKCKECDGTMHRIPEVFDPWVESGSMPFGQLHYPFENKDLFEKTYPADYITEYVAQIRAWFYCMHVMGNAVFEENSFKNILVNGVLAGNDGRKMSKSFGNYEDPKETLKEYGGDTIRLYLLKSPLITGDNPNFDIKEIENQLKKVLLPLTNVVRYLQTYAKLHNWKPSNLNEPESNNILDKWAITRLKSFHKEFEDALNSYDIPSAVREIEPFIDDISTWYIRRSRDRFVNGDTKALSTLYYSLYKFSVISASVIPFITERIYERLVLNLFPDEKKSIHLRLLDDYKDLENEEVNLLNEMNIVRNIASKAQSIRVENGMKIRQPLQTLYVVGFKELSDWMTDMLKDELNVKEIVLDKFEGADSIKTKDFVLNSKKYMVGLDLEVSPKLEDEGILNELVRNIQITRKKSNCKQSESIKLAVHSENNRFQTLVNENKDYIKESTNLESLELEENKGREFDIKDFTVQAEVIK